MKKSHAVLFLSLLSVIFSCGKNNEPIDTTTKPASFKYLALGDSYTKGEGVGVAESFPFQLINGLHEEALIESGSIEIIAKTGWTTTELKNAIEANNDTATYNLVTLLIGVNNIYRNYPIELYETEFQQLLQYAIGKANNKAENVIVLSIPDYGYTPFGKNNKEKISSEVNKYNNINKALTLSSGATYIDITAISRKGLEQPVLVASDNLHPSVIMYAMWAELLQEDVKRIIR